ncbi:hypothetical protein SAMN05421747_102185 [Parapedobacter composti]|uniref:Uncharacterized protein n=1 Tax=Parapedobacter composti TaxID=623281 RepID=A0A1I1F1P2_9SPHI|nr:hypothetical protein [Parapedobacter composti]SFB93234.1 hypothetical protein SAMN05421747_102185 [Parapedobacter composti]
MVSIDIISFFIDVLKYTLAGCAVVGVANLIFWPKYNNQVFRLKVLDARHASQKEVLPLRLQAYERLVLFVERINPSNLLVRLHEPGLKAVDFQHMLLNEIRAEYQHNITQQLYVSDTAWAVTKQLKDQTIALIRNAVAGLPDTASAKELSTVLLNHVAAMEENPYSLALKTIKNELAG